MFISSTIIRPFLTLKDKKRELSRTLAHLNLISLFSAYLIDLISKAIDWLREKGIGQSFEKESRIAAEGTTYIVTNDHKAVMIEVNSETDFVAQMRRSKRQLSKLPKLF